MTALFAVVLPGAAAALAPGGTLAHLKSVARHQRTSFVRLQLSEDDSQPWSPSVGGETPPEIKAAAAEVRRLLEEARIKEEKAAAKEERRLQDEDRQSKIAGIFESHDYLDEREELVGELSSSELLQRDEDEGFWPPDVPKERDAKAMLWVDQHSCIGCRWCAGVARSTFQMEDEYGTAKVVQQGGDNEDTVQEAIDVCMADCIHYITRDELVELEEYRDKFQDDLMAKSYHGSRLVGWGDGGGAGATPHWRDPLVNTGWRQGAKFVQTERLKAGLDDVLLHESGGQTEFASRAKPAVFDATGRNWPRTASSLQPAEEGDEQELDGQ
tara:strand:+ start:83 stop:1063 length:981 start_codon:yes stop_codon:yes gene_type:complete